MSLINFINDIEAFAEKTEGAIEDVVRGVRLQALTLPVKKMPVDTGQARGSVVASIGSPNDSPLNLLDKTVEGAIARAQSAIDAPVDSLFIVSSNIPYMWTLEYGGYGRGEGATNKTTRDGYSVQAPNGMFRISAIELRQGIKDVINNVKS